MSIKLHMPQGGDTIVEVLIAMLVLSVVLGGAYVSANRSLNGTRQSEERGQAQHFVEAQLEKAKALLARPTGDPDRTALLTQTTHIFCIDTGTHIVESYSPPVNQSPFPSIDADNFANHTPACRAGDPAGIPYYLLAIQTAAPPQHDFTFYARWERSGGNGREEAKITYRLYE